MLMSVDGSDEPAARNESNDIHIKKFTLSSYNIFSKFVASESSSPTALLNTSGLLRDVLRVLLTDIDSIAEVAHSTADLAGESDGADSPEIQQLLLSYDLVKNIERTWHVCEVLFLNPHQNTLVLEFMRWLKGQHEPFFLAQRLNDLLEGSNNSSGGTLEGLKHAVDYWPLLMDLVSHGRLHHVAQLLGPHSRFARLSQQQPALGSEFLDTLGAHPYAALVDTEDESSSSAGAGAGLGDVAQRLLEWQARVTRLQARWEAAAQSVGAVMPELNRLLDVLRGDERVLLEESRGSYSRYLLLLLLYKYAPTLSGSDLHSLVRHSLQVCGRLRGDQAVVRHGDGAEEENSMADVLLACLRGDAGSILRQTYEAGVLARDSVPSAAPVATQCCVHLGELLVRAGVATEIARPLSGPGDTCFLEEVTLQLAEALNDRLYPVECIQGYLTACAVRGKVLAQELLLRRVPLTDDDALRLARALQQVQVPGCSAPGDAYAGDTAAAQVLLTRAESWYRRGSRRGLVRAVYFYQLAGNTARSTACLERVLWALSASVRACSTLFQGLTFYPDQPSNPILGYRLQWSGSFDETHERIRQKFALNDLSIYMPPRHWPVHYVNSPAWRELMGESEGGADPDIVPVGPVEPVACSLDELRETTRFAQDMLGAVRDPQFLATDAAAVALAAYTRAVSALTLSVEASFKLHDLALSIALVAQQSKASITTKREHVTEAVLEGCVSCLEGFHSAAADAHSLLTSRTVPRGYWLHLLELCAWVDQQAREARDTVRALCALALPLPAHVPLLQRLGAFGACTFSKAQAYALISALVQLENGPESNQYLAYTSPEEVAQLRLSLTGLLSAAAAHEGADTAAERARGIAASQAQKEFLSLSRPHSEPIAITSVLN